MAIHSDTLEKSTTTTLVPCYHNLFLLGLSEREFLIKRIAQWGGLIRIFVHPMYEKWRGNEEEYLDDPSKHRLVEIEQTLSRLAALPVKKTPPIMVMEEAVYLYKLQEWLIKRPRFTSKQPTYLIGTTLDDPTPTGTKSLDPWAHLTKILQKLGVKKILLGGMQLEVRGWSNDWTYKRPWVGRCVGIALSHLATSKAGQFEVALSSLIDPPGSRNDFMSYAATHKSE